MIFRLKRPLEDTVRLADEDSSTSSTHKVDHLPKKPLHEDFFSPSDTSDDEDDDKCSITSEDSEEADPSLSSLVSKKCVTFDLENNVEYSNIDDEDSDAEFQKEVRWYSRDDYKRFKTQHVKAVVRAATASETRNCAPLSYCKVMRRTYEVCRSAHCADGSSASASILSEREMAHLKRWVEFTPSRIGLEKLTVKEIGHDLKLRRAELYDTVLGLQEEAQMWQPSEGNDEYFAEMIRQCSERISRPSRWFSRSLAEAQATVLFESEAVASTLPAQ